MNAHMAPWRRWVEFHLLEKPLAWIAPLALVMVGLSLYPFFYSIYLSVHEFNSFRRELVFVGFDNWMRMFTDAKAIRAFSVTMIYFSVCLVAELVLGLALALLLDGASRMYGFLRSLMLLPLVIPPAVVGMMFLLMENSQFGIISWLLTEMGLISPDEPLLVSSTTALIGVMIADIWQWTPFITLIMLAGLRSLPREPFEAAVLDGAKFSHMLFSLALPMMSRVIAVATLVRGIDLFRTFDYVFVMTSGGPGIATQTLSYYTWKQSFAFIKWGYGATLSLFAVIFLIILAQLLIKAARIRW